MRTYPRQKLYDVGHAQFFGAMMGGKLNDGNDADFAATMSRFIGAGERTLIPLSRGRLGAYFAVKSAVNGRRRKVLMSPFTIFDMVNMVICAGGEPVFVDSRPDDVHVGRQAVSDALDDEVAAVIITHYHTSNPEIAAIAETVRDAGAVLIEDCAISVGGRPAGRHVGMHGDFGVFSFGLFKFIATYFGGGLLVRDSEVADRIQAEMADWPKMAVSDLRPYLIKGIKLDTLTSPLIFSLLTFPAFRFGYERNIAWVKAQAVNDPEPLRRTQLPDAFKRRPSDFQQREWVRQLDGVTANRERRLENASVYHQSLSNAHGIVTPPAPDAEADCFLNYPVLVEDRDAVLVDMMKRGFDLSQYFYRDCSSLDAFRDLEGDTPNLADTVSRLLVLPCYPAVPQSYARDLAEALKDVVGRRAA
jgi:dTDP-4-amino-4,6-dideoxygalactose transaminase